MTNHNIMAFDFGDKNIGVAVGQQITYTARSLKTLKTINGKPDWKKIKLTIHEWSPKIIIIGLPLHMNGNEQPITKKVYYFKKKIQIFFNYIKIFLHDERLTSIEARSRLFNRNGYKELTKNNINAESAIIILESWLQQNINNKILDKITN